MMEKLDSELSRLQNFEISKFLFVCLMFTDLADPRDPGASGPFLDDPTRSQAFRAHLGRPRHQGMQNNDFSRNGGDDSRRLRSRGTSVRYTSVSEYISYGCRHLLPWISSLASAQYTAANTIASKDGRQAAP